MLLALVLLVLVCQLQVLSAALPLRALRDNLHLSQEPLVPLLRSCQVQQLPVIMRRLLT